MPIGPGISFNNITASPDTCLPIIMKPNRMIEKSWKNEDEGGTQIRIADRVEMLELAANIMGQANNIRPVLLNEDG